MCSPASSVHLGEDPAMDRQFPGQFIDPQPPNMSWVPALSLLPAE